MIPYPCRQSHDTLAENKNGGLRRLGGIILAVWTQQLKARLENYMKRKEKGHGHALRSKIRICTKIKLVNGVRRRTDVNVREW